MKDPEHPGKAWLRWVHAELLAMTQSKDLDRAVLTLAARIGDPVLADARVRAAGGVYGIVVLASEVAEQRGLGDVRLAALAVIILMDPYGLAAEAVGRARAEAASWRCFWEDP